MIYRISPTIGNSVGFITIATSEMRLDEERAAYEKHTPGHTTHCLGAPHTLAAEHNTNSLVAAKRTQSAAL